MNFLKYVWRNVTRNKLRTMLTIFSVGFSLALLTILLGYVVAQSVWKDEASQYNRLVVMNTQGFAGLVPIAYVDRVAKLEGIQAAVPYAWFGGNYKEKQMPFAQFATDPHRAFHVWTEFTIDAEQLKAWQSNRRGCVVDRRLAAKQGWKLGERIPLQGTYYPVTLELELVGTFDTPTNTDSLWFDWKYLDESLQAMSAPGSGNAGIIFAKATSPDVMPGLAQQIDEQFGSSENPTRTQTEAAFAQMFADMLGNLQNYILFFGVAVVIALLLVNGNTMAMSIRERTTEIAVLKAIGFSRARVTGLVICESCGIALLGCVCGVSIGCAVLQILHQSLPQAFQVPLVELAGPWLLGLFGIATAIGLISGLFPAIGAARLSVVNGLRKVI